MPLFDSTTINPKQRPTQTFQNLGQQLALSLGGAAPGALNQGFGNLSSILGSQGKLDPQAFNQILAQTARGNQTAQQGVQGNLARAGLQGSGIGQAIGAAAGVGGVGQIAGLKAQNSAQADERKRNDLNLLLSLLFDPILGLTGTGVQGEQARADRKAQSSAAKLGALSSLLGGFASANPFGGNKL